MDSLNDMTFAQLDPEIQAVLDAELGRQRDTLEMIASKNFAPRAVLEAQGPVLTNKYAEGYPSRRYHGDYEFVDVAESLVTERVKQALGGGYVNVQPHAGVQANAVALMAMASVDDPIPGLPLVHGGHLTHGMRLNFPGKSYKAVAYKADRETMRIEPEKACEAVLVERPYVIIAGWSAYPRRPDLQAFRDIADEVGAALWVDVAHFAGLVAAGLHPNPVPFADVVTTTVHKTLGSPRSGMILSPHGEQWDKKPSSSVFPGQQDDPFMHAIAAKVIAIKVIQADELKDRQCHTLEGVQIITGRLGADDAKTVGIKLVMSDTDVHLVLVDLVDSELSGRQAEDLLHEVDITINRNVTPFDPRPPAVTSGLRIGTPVLATCGFDAEDFAEVADTIGTTLSQGASGGNVEVDTLRAHVKRLTDKHPLYARL